jgi:hypothetical protein
MVESPGISGGTDSGKILAEREKGIRGGGMLLRPVYYNSNIHQT